MIRSCEDCRNPWRDTPRRLWPRSISIQAASLRTKSQKMMTRIHGGHQTPPIVVLTSMSRRSSDRKVTPKNCLASRLRRYVLTRYRDTHAIPADNWLIGATAHRPPRLREELLDRSMVQWSPNTLQNTQALQ